MMSQPFRGSPSLPFDTVSHPTTQEGRKDIHEDLANLPEPRKHYMGYYSTQLAAEDMDNPKDGVHQFLREYFHLKSADWEGNKPAPLKGWDASELAKLPYYYVMPLQSGMAESVQISMAKEDAATVSKLGQRWLSDEDLSVYSDSWKRTGFQGGLNWYRVVTNPNIMKDVELFAGIKIDVPSLFVSGKQDWGTYQEPGVVHKMHEVCSEFQGVELIDGAGHWVQQEQPEKLVEILAKFLRAVKKDSVSY
jgi:pimeloyl-ACP methyl ester carboxylesterase